MKRAGVLLFCFLMQTHINALHTAPDAERHSHAQELIKKVITAYGIIQIPEDTQQKIEEFLFNLLSLNKDELSYVAQQVKDALDKELAAVKKTEKDYEKKGDVIPTTLFFKQFLLEKQIEHLNTFIQSSLIAQVKHIFKTEERKNLINTIVNQLLDYIAFEREHILYDYDNALTFLQAREKMQLPPIIDFWNTSQVQEKIKKRTQELNKTKQVALQQGEETVLKGPERRRIEQKATTTTPRAVVKAAPAAGEAAETVTNAMDQVLRVALPKGGMIESLEDFTIGIMKATIPKNAIVNIFGGDFEIFFPTAEKFAKMMPKYVELAGEDFAISTMIPSPKGATVNITEEGFEVLARTGKPSGLATMGASFAIQGMIMASFSFVTARIKEQEQKKIFEKYMKKQVEVGQGYDEFQKNLQQQQVDIISKFGKTFATYKKKLNEQYEETNKRLHEELVYLNRAINLDEPLQHYLESWIEWDRFFETSKMFTPATAFDWRNVFNIFTKDDWQFDPRINGFWQNSLVSFPKTLYWQQPVDKRDLVNNDPAMHAIFNEYIANKNSYEIEVECEVVNTTYPFFVGIMFNRGRWISGDPERLWWYRLLGLYGEEKKEGAETKKEISLRFAQQNITFTPQKKEEITAPLQQIIENKKPYITYQLDAQTAKKLERDPITFIFDITTQPSTVTISLFQKTNGETKKLYSTTISQLDSYVFRYHGIGFIAIGAQASFKIKKPNELIFNQKELDAFQQKE